MAMKELLGSLPATRVSYPPSRVRTMLRALVDEVEAKMSNGEAMNLNRVQASKARLLAELQTALDAYTQLDELVVQVAAQRQVIDEQLSEWVHFMATVRSGLVAIAGLKPRRKRTTAEKALTIGRRLDTRRQLGTLGKNQKKRKLAAARGKG